jgi:hypothetical protein
MLWLTPQTDKAIGARVRMFRIQRRLSQTDLGKRWA